MPIHPKPRASRFQLFARHAFSRSSRPNADDGHNQPRKCRQITRKFQLSISVANLLRRKRRETAANRARRIRVARARQ
jgi:hypothetical protein